jgi:hypothetical protein
MPHIMKKILITIAISFLSLSLFSQGALNAFNFDGIDDKVEIGNVDFQFESQITVMGWIKWNVDPITGDNWANIVSANSKYSSDKGQFWIQHSKSNNKLEFALELDNGRQYIWSKTSMEEGVWIHFAATYNGRVQRLYINGVMEANKGRHGNIRTFESDIETTIGCWAANGGGRFFNGEIDEISIWNVALTEDQIRDYMTEKLDENQNGLLAYYNFDKLDNNLLIDLANDNDGNVFQTNTVVSTAPVGDESVNLYGDGDLIMESSDNMVKLSDFSSTPKGVHIYKVNEAPSIVDVENLDLVEIIEDSYWGVFVVGDKNSTFRYTQKIGATANVTVNDSLTIAQRDNATSKWDWQDVNQSIEDSTIFFYTEESYIHREFILAKADPSLLPIELLSFNVVSMDNAVLINWSTASEINNDYFTVERSIDGSYWEDIAYVEGAENSNITVNYEIVDNDPVSGVSFYRLKQTDFDGTSETFKILAIESSLVNELEVSVFPNPVVNVLNIQNESNDNLEVYLVNSRGQRIAVNVVNVSGQVQIDMASFSKGMYHLQIVSETGTVITKQIVKM